MVTNRTIKQLEAKVRDLEFELAYYKDLQGEDDTRDPEGEAKIASHLSIALRLGYKDSLVLTSLYLSGGRVVSASSLVEDAGYSERSSSLRLLHLGIMKIRKTLVGRQGIQTVGSRGYRITREGSVAVRRALTTKHHDKPLQSSHNRRFKPAEVRSIRRSKEHISALARQHHCSPTTIQDMQKFRTYKWVTEDAYHQEAPSRQKR